MRLKIEKRLEPPKFSNILIPVISVLIALLIMGLAITLIKAKLPKAMMAGIEGAKQVYFNRLESYLEKYSSGIWEENRRKISSRIYSAFWTLKTDVNSAVRSYKNALNFLKETRPEKVGEYFEKLDAVVLSLTEKLNDLYKDLSSSVRNSKTADEARKLVREHEEKISDVMSKFKRDVDSITNELWIGLSATLYAYKEMFTWPFVLGMGLGDTFMKMVPLLLIGLGLIVVFQMSIWNIGAEGQYYLGVLAATWMSLFLIKNPQSYHIPLILLFGAAAGAFWGFIPGFLKAYLNMDEIVTTLMLNYIAFHWMEYLVYGPWKSPTGYNFPLTETFSEKLWLPTFGETSIHTGLVIALAMVGVIHILMYRTRWGFDLRITGDNVNAARYAGINIAKNIVSAMMLSGAMAGLAGAVQMLGVEHMLQHGYHPGYGYTGIIIAWLARLNPWAVIVVSFLFGGLIVGSEQLQIVLQLPVAMVNVLQGLLLFSLLGSEVLFKYRIRIIKG